MSRVYAPPPPGLSQWLAVWWVPPSSMWCRPMRTDALRSSIEKCRLVCYIVMRTTARLVHDTRLASARRGCDDACRRHHRARVGTAVRCVFRQRARARPHARSCPGLSWQAQVGASSWRMPSAMQACWQGAPDERRRVEKVPVLVSASV